MLRVYVYRAHSLSFSLSVSLSAASPLSMGQPNSGWAYDYSKFLPFNSPSHYHSCNGCPSDCNIRNWAESGDRSEYLNCRLQNLPDLDQSNPYVRQTLLSAVRSLVNEFAIDGLRVDTVPEVPGDFWAAFQQAAGVYAVGEVFSGNLKFVAGYQSPTQGLNAVLSYPLYYALRSTFVLNPDVNAIRNVVNVLNDYNGAFSNVDTLGTFVENHDNERWLSMTLFKTNYQLYKASVVFSMFVRGIPISYYGTSALRAHARAGTRAHAHASASRVRLYMHFDRGADSLSLFVSTLSVSPLRSPQVSSMSSPAATTHSTARRCGRVSTRPTAHSTSG
jgi:hypothetical protein